MTIALNDIIDAVERNGGNQAAAARDLGISRQAVHYRLVQSSYRRPPSSHQEFEKVCQKTLEVLQENRGSVTAAARELEVSRNTVLYRIRRIGRTDEIIHHASPPRVMVCLDHKVYARVEDAAEKLGLTPNEWAKRVLMEAL